jgi:hypothetical protein
VLTGNLRRNLDDPELCGDALTRNMVAAMLATGRELHSHPVALLEGVEETLMQIAGRVRLIVVTKGDLLHQETSHESAQAPDGHPRFTRLGRFIQGPARMA